MSYSDYGGYAFRRTRNGSWTRHPPAEDGTLVGIQAPKDRPLEKVTGLKLDVLIHAYKKQGVAYGKEEAERIDWLVGHPHHCVLGELTALGLVGHKQDVRVVWKGKEMFSFPDYDKQYSDDPEVKAEAKKELLVTKTGDVEGWKWALRHVDYPHSTGCMMLLRDPKGQTFSGVTGYGIGDHWWKDKEGYEHYQPGERIELTPKPLWERLTNKKKRFTKADREELKRKTISKSPRDFSKKELERLKKTHEMHFYWDSDSRDEDEKRFCVKGRVDLGRKPQAPWPGFEDWKKRITRWADETLKEWKEA